MGGHFVRTIGLLRTQVKIGMMNRVYNMIRLVQLLKRDAKMTGQVRPQQRKCGEKQQQTLGLSD